MSKLALKVVDCNAAEHVADMDNHILHCHMVEQAAALGAEEP